MIKQISRFQLRKNAKIGNHFQFLTYDTRQTTLFCVTPVPHFQTKVLMIIFERSSIPMWPYPCQFQRFPYSSPTRLWTLAYCRLLQKNIPKSTTPNLSIKEPTKHPSRCLGVLYKGPFPFTKGKSIKLWVQQDLIEEVQSLFSQLCRKAHLLGWNLNWLLCLQAPSLCFCSLHEWNQSNCPLLLLPLYCHNESITT